MDREMAGAVFQRWEQGLPVSESAFYKAAALIGVDPEAALTEARFLTAFDKYASESRAMTPIEKMYFGLAAGIEDPLALIKTAGTYQIDEEDLICRVLEQRRYLPDFEKIALMPPPEAIQEMMNQQMGGSDGSGAGGNGGGNPAAGGAGGADPAAAAQQAAMPQGPMPGQQLQQQQAARFKPAPTAPDQVAPSSMGNLEELLQGQQEVHGDQAMENGGLPPSGAQEPAPPPPAPEERIQQVAPGMDPETTGRYATKLQEFEQDMGMQISDPKQLVKFVQELQKLDGKYVQEGIKQKMQQWEAEMGIGQTVDAPTVPGFGHGEQGDAAAPGGAGGETPPSPPQAAEAGAGGTPGGAPMPGGGQGAGGGKGGKIQPGQPLPAAVAAGKKPPAQQSQQAATEKVANAARALARAHAKV
jgi:hypothetical protein